MFGMYQNPDAPELGADRKNKFWAGGLALSTWNDVRELVRLVVPQSGLSTGHPRAEPIRGE